MSHGDLLRDSPGPGLTFGVAIIGARAFTTTQSAQAHFILFRRIFEIATADTGCAVRFHYMHGEGIQTIVADAHKGQGLGEYIFLHSRLVNHSTIQQA